MDKFCCDELKKHLNSEVAITYIPKFREYGVTINDGGTALQLISYCPWCGTKFQDSLRDIWFDIVFDELGIDDPSSLDVPKNMLSDLWWKESKR